MRRRTGYRRWFLLALLYGTLIVGGVVLERQLADFADFYVYPGGETSSHRMVGIVIAVYALVMAMPFVPAAEIGLSLMLMLGPQVALLVYLSTVLSLTLAYFIGRAVPASACASAFDFLGFRRAHGLVLQMSALDAHARLELLLARAPVRIVPRLLRHRYLALAVALNLPGNTLVGGGGGIALSAGMSGLYPLPAFVATVAVAVAPVPLLIALLPLLR